MKKISLTCDTKLKTSTFAQYHILGKIFLKKKIFSYWKMLQFEINFSYALKESLGGKKFQRIFHIGNVEIEQSNILKQN